jgi:hypothetical protein
MAAHNSTTTTLGSVSNATDEYPLHAGTRFAVLHYLPMATGSLSLVGSLLILLSIYVTKRLIVRAIVPVSRAEPVMFTVEFW